MKKSSQFILTLVAATSATFAQSASQLLSGEGIFSGGPQLEESGQTYQLCTYELCRTDENGRVIVEPVAAGSISAIIAQASDTDEKRHLVFYPAGQENNPKARRVLRNRYLIEVLDGTDLEALKERCGILSLRRASEGSNLVICEEESAGRAFAQLTRVEADPAVSSAKPLFAKTRNLRRVPTDPFYDAVSSNSRPDGNYQWYLKNVGINGGVEGIDINLEGALDFATGVGVRVAVVDDGLAFDHEEFGARASAPHLNFYPTDETPENNPATFDITLNHGTNVAGLIGAGIDNGIGITGVAPGANLSGIRLLSGLVDDADEAAALAFERQQIQIYNNSWGPDDETLNFEVPGSLTLNALQTGVETGRVVGGVARGSIFVWSAGNGGEIFDNSNYDGYANSKYTIAVGAVDDSGRKASYSERGSNLVVVAPSSGGAQNVLTTSFGIGVDDDDNPIRLSEFDPDFSGTSASTALVSGVVALMLQADPSLSWRDVQDILIRTARKIDDTGGWIANGAGLEFNYDYGSGLIDAEAAVRAARSRATNTVPRLGAVQRQVRSRFFGTDVNNANQESGVVPDNSGESLLVAYDMTKNAGGEPLENLRVEHVEFNATVITPNRAELEIALISPNGTESILQEVNEDHQEQSIFRWTFSSVRHWGEGSAGIWVVRVTDRVTGNQAVLNNATLVINGTVDPNAPVLQQPLLTSGRLITADQGRALTYQVETSGGASVTVGDLPPGVTYNPTTRIISGTPTQAGLYDVPIVITDAEGVEGTFQITIIVRPTAVALGDAVGLPGVPAVFGGDVPWDFELTDTNSPVGGDGRAARSGINLGNNEQSIFGFDGLSRGVIMFDWKTSSEEGFDRLWFNRGGQIPQTWDCLISGGREWGRVGVVLPNASNNVRWIYSKDANFGEGEDRGLVDNVEVMEFGKYVEDFRRAGNVTGIDFEFDSRTLFLASPFEFGSPATPGAPGESLISSTVGNGQTVSISSWLEGPGTLSFQAVNYGQRTDVFEFLLDGVPLNVLVGSGAVGDAFSSLLLNRKIPEGRHRIQLRYRKDFRISEGRIFEGSPLDGVVLDNISFVPDGSFSTFISDFGPGFDADPNSDPDGDGYSNHLEYAFGGNPALADQPKYLPRVLTSGSQRFIEFGIDRSKLDLRYTPQQSGDLRVWEAAQLTTLNRVEGEVDVYRIPVTSVAGREDLFFRVHAEQK